MRLIRKWTQRDLIRIHGRGIKETNMSLARRLGIKLSDLQYLKPKGK